MQQTILKKKIIMAIIGGVVVSGLGGISYIFYSYFKPVQKISSTTNKATLPDGTNVSITVNNMIDNEIKPIPLESKPLLIAPALPRLERFSASQPVTQLMQQQPIPQPISANNAAALAKPNMLVVSNGVTNSTDANAISATDTSIGTGEIAANMKRQRSPYTLFAGTNLPCQMQTGLNTDVNGMLICIITNNVYDSTLGKYLLIPQGTKLLGTYNKGVAYGLNRVMAGWNRAIYPNGTSILLHGQPGTDLQGYSGLTGSVDNHYLQIFGSSAIMGGIMGAEAAAMGGQNASPYSLSPGAVISQQVAGQMTQAGIQVVQKSLSIPPTIIVPPGTQIYVLLTADLILKPYIYK